MLFKETELWTCPLRVGPFSIITMFMMLPNAALRKPFSTASLMMFRWAEYHRLLPSKGPWDHSISPHIPPGLGGRASRQLTQSPLLSSLPPTGRALEGWRKAAVLDRNPMLAFLMSPLSPTSAVSGQAANRLRTIEPSSWHSEPTQARVLQKLHFGTRFQGHQQQ